MVIDVRNVTIIRDSRYILKEVNWFVRKGEHWAILGLNGSDAGVRESSEKVNLLFSYYNIEYS